MKTSIAFITVVAYLLQLQQCYSQSDELDDGSPSSEVNASCKTPNDKPATCMVIYECPVLYDQLTSAKQSTIDFVRASDCGVHQSLPLVCCGKDYDYDEDHQPATINKSTTKKVVKGPTVNLETRFSDGDGNGIAGRHECGYMADQDRILNGIVTSIDEFPWMALLEYERKDRAGRKFLCGGSLIGSRYVLTAAHCVAGEIKNKYNLVGVRLGEYNLQQEEDCVRYGGYQECADPPVNVGIERVTAHPRYDETLREKPNDIALLKLAQEISYTGFIQPICLPSAYDASAAGERLFVAGWGRTEKLNASAVKLKLQVPLTTRRYCRNMFRKAGANIRDTQICAGGEQGRDSCTGDSGGPLMTLLPNSGNQQWYLEGVVSFGTTCGLKGWPGVYTKVNSYLDWIQQNVD